MLELRDGSMRMKSIDYPAHLLERRIIECTEDAGVFGVGPFGP